MDPNKEDSGSKPLVAIKRVESGFSCPHYKRKCQFYTPCCRKVYRCKFCHDSKEDHQLDRDLVKDVQCSNCDMVQPIRKSCQRCKITFGKYFCLACKLLDDEAEQQFHCDGCGICRIGDKKRFFHCGRCNMCLPVHMKGNHRCIENVSRRNCPVCLNDIHTSREPSQIPKCHHLIHESCFHKLLKNNIYTCPVCSTSLISDLGGVWRLYDEWIESSPMPEVYGGVHVLALCRDCWKKSTVRYHVIGLKCPCGSYNTVREKGPFLRRGAGDGDWLPVDAKELLADAQPSAMPPPPPPPRPPAAGSSDAGDEESTSKRDLAPEEEATASGASLCCLPRAKAANFSSKKRSKRSKVAPPEARQAEP